MTEQEPTEGTSLSFTGNTFVEDNEREKRKKRKHRATFPTPEFYLFAFLLNIAPLALSAWLISMNPLNIELVSLGVLSGIGVFISLFILKVKPTTATKKKRKILISVSAAYGFVMLLVHFVSFAIHPGTYLF